MNPRLPYAGDTLINEIIGVLADDDGIGFTNGNLDGLGVYRSLTITGGDTLGIGETLSRISAMDRRIQAVEVDDDTVTVTFPPDQIVWSRHRFGVHDIYHALAEEAPPKKRGPRKKASPKKKAEDTTE